MSFLSGISKKIKISSAIVVILLPSACTQPSTSTELFWDYAPFEPTPKVSLQQAHSICNGYANNAAKSAGQNNSYSGTADFGSQITSMYINRANMQSAYNNIYTSCMAQNGWNAQLLRRAISSEMNDRTEIKLITCKKKDGEVMKIRITADACLYNGGTVL